MSERECPCKEYKIFIDRNDLNRLLLLMEECSLFPQEADLEKDPQVAPPCWQSPLLQQSGGRTAPKREGDSRLITVRAGRSGHRPPSL